MKNRTLLVPWTLAAALFLCLAVTPTAVRAQLVSVNAITNNANILGISFGTPLTLPSATNPSNYIVYTKTGTIGITGVNLSTNAQFVTLTLVANVPEFIYLTVSNVMDIATNVINAERLGYISDYGNDDVGTIGDPSPAGQVFTASGDAFDVTVGGSDVGGTSDAFHFIYRDVIGDFDTSVFVSQLDPTDPASKAGLMARESLAVNSATLQTYFTPTAGNNEVEVAVRSTTGGGTTDSGFQIGARASATPLRYLRLTRTNNTFTAYHGIDGTNGVVWTVSGVTTQAFNTNLLLGLMTVSAANGFSTTAKFLNFDISGERPGDGIVPSLSATLVSSNLVLNWARTPRDFAIEASTNLLDWAILLLPILENSTNTTLRSMVVPMSLSPDHWFMRLTRVERVIPDPPLILTTGIILSPGLGLNTTTVAGNVLCPCSSGCPSYANIPVISVYAQTQPSGQVIAAKGTPVTFTSVNCDALVDSVLQVRNPAGVRFCDDNSAGDNKAVVVTPTTAANRTNAYTIIVAPRSGAPAAYPAMGVLRVQVTY